jgi:hypothetical protein
VSEIVCALSELLLLTHWLEIIFADTMFPERNRELDGVYHMRDIPALDGKTFLYGFAIIHEIDI